MDLNSKHRTLILRTGTAVLGLCLAFGGISRAFKTYLLSTRGLTAEATLADIGAEPNTLRGGGYGVKFLFRDQAGNPRFLDGRITRAEKQRYYDESGNRFPLIYVPGASAYAVAAERPILLPGLVAGAVLLLAGIWVFVLAFRLRV